MPAPRPASAAALCAALAAPAPGAAALHAQQPPAAPRDTAAGRRDTTRAAPLAAVRVTAARRAATVRPPDAPVSLGALGSLPPLAAPFSTASFGAPLVEALQARSLSELVRRDPSTLVANPDGGYGVFQTVRGFELGGGGVRYDGLDAGSAFSATFFPLHALERVDVLKGPSAGLYAATPGAGPGGLVNLVPKRPPAAAAARVAAFEGAFTGRDLFTARADVGGRAGRGRAAGGAAGEGAFGYRVNAMAERGTLAAQRQQRRYSAVDASADWRPNDRLTVAAGAHRVDTRVDGYLDVLGLAEGVPVPRAPDATRQITQPWSVYRQDVTFGEARADWRVSDAWTVTAQGMGGRFTSPYLSSFATILNPAGDLAFYATQAFDDSFTNFRTGQVAARGAVRTGRVGHALTVSATAAGVRGGGTWDDSDAELASNLYAPVALAAPAIDRAGVSVYRGRDRSVTAGVLDVLTLSPRWSALAGVNYTRIGSGFTFGPDAGAPDARATARVVPTAAALFRATPRLSAYASYGQGLEPGGTAPETAANPRARLRPLRSAQAEVGAKWEARPGLLVSAAAFRIERGLEFLDPATNVYGQLGRRRHDGVELSAAGALGADLSVSGGVMLLDPVARATGDPAVDGKRPAGVPRVNVSLFGEYRLSRAPAAALRGLALNAAVEHRGRQFLDPANARALPAWTRVDAGLSYPLAAAGRAGRLTLRVDNVFDRAFWAAAPFGALALGGPRTVSAGARTEF